MDKKFTYKAGQVESVRLTPEASGGYILVRRLQEKANRAKRVATEVEASRLNGGLTREGIESGTQDISGDITRIGYDGFGLYAVREGVSLTLDGEEVIVGPAMLEEVAPHPPNKG